MAAAAAFAAPPWPPPGSTRGRRVPQGPQQAASRPERWLATRLGCAASSPPSAASVERCAVARRRWAAARGFSLLRRAALALCGGRCRWLAVASLVDVPLKHAVRRLSALVIARMAVAPRPGGKRTVPCLRRQAHRAMPAVALPPTAPPTLTYLRKRRRVACVARLSLAAGARRVMPRGKHPDAQLQGPRRNLSPDVEAVVRRGTLVAQTPDGSCLFNSFAYCEQQDAGWLFGAATPASIRRQCAEWLQEHGN
ncbi:hypothetical protein EMIHUDRAFT_234676 [Emiliania huxleyi CCMP1516]|uniref:OTU domain-containing protein n=2 Tax=Emiliania huxleyi TaxID=2903 RepID=A0A0D3JYX5_EMIH1|nr:hypothetical protein EMIHUDRAFT_234676 [Emiliania huxleyi CCMP1516]EOD28710.1 hypothetical protein EMIHUDRAFT_234676 [Emiliania huxleyi CCMP1516]|eukprot:XP_005781139.1 hypothetical protein EMIHUDRAFT_234676 [Emiliania huxleyi CCMP1516]